MTLPVGQISFSEVNVEITRPSTQQLELNDSTVRTLAGVGGSGTTISMSNLQGKTFVTRIPISLVISSPVFNYDVYTNRGPTYVPGTSDITVTVNPGVAVGNFSPNPVQGNPGALVVPSAFSPADTITIVNNGRILGKGGVGGQGFSTGPGSSGQPGYTALFVQRPVTVNNLGIIAGGGGGGGAGARAGPYPGPFPRPPRQGGPTTGTITLGGGAGGGGAGYDLAPGGFTFNTPGSAIGAQPGTASSYVLPSTFSPGAGAASYPTPTGGTGAGGSGGGLGQAGQNGSPSPASTEIGSGGAAGKYVEGNSFVTWQNTGTRQGGVA